MHDDKIGKVVGMAGIDVHVTVPEGTVSELLAFAASLWGAEADPSKGDEVRIREAYEGGESEYWRPFLVYLAEHADQWVRLSDAFAAVSLTSSEGTGMLGAAERRCGAAGVPYAKRWRAGKRDFCMNAATAKVVLSLAN
jgi:hypothetical protein